MPDSKKRDAALSTIGYIAAALAPLAELKESFSKVTADDIDHYEDFKIVIDHITNGNPEVYKAFDHIMDALEGES